MVIMMGKAKVPKTWANYGALVITCQCLGQYSHYKRDSDTCKMDKNSGFTNRFQGMQVVEHFEGMK